MSISLNGRVTVYTNEVPYETDVLQTGLYKMVGDSHLAECILGTGIGNPDLFNGVPCLPVSPPGLAVTVDEGRMYHYEAMDALAWSSLPANTTNFLYKQFINFNLQTFPTPAPSTVGYTIIYLIQGAPQTIDSDVTSRPYFNSADPTMPIINIVSGVRADNLLVQIKAGIAGVVPATPLPDPGFVGMYTVAVSYGQSVIVSGNINPYPGTQFITESLTQKISSATIAANYVQKVDEQNATYIYAFDVGSANHIVINPSPNYSAPNPGQRLYVQTPFTNTGATTITINSNSAKPVVQLHPSGTGVIPLSGGEISGAGSGNSVIYEFIYDGTAFQLMNATPAAQVAPIPAGVITSFGGTSAPAGWLLCNGSAVSRTTYSVLFGVIGTAFGSGDGSTTFNLPAQARRTLVGAGGSGTGTLGNAVGNTGGEETHTQLEAELAAHSHPVSTFIANSTIGGSALVPILVAGNAIEVDYYVNVASDGSSTPFNVMQPSLVVNYIIKY